MRFLSLVSIVALGLSLAACDMFGSDSVDSDPVEAELSVRLTDAPFPFDLAAEANVTITRIELLAADEAEDDTSATADTTETVRDRIVLYDGEPVALNLLDFRDGVDTLLVSGFTIPADGSYNRLRFFVGEDAEVVFTNGTTYALKLPSAQQSGIKVTLPDYDVDSADGEIDVLVDFNVEDSFVTRGNPLSASFQGFLFKPVLKVESFEVRTSDGDDPSDAPADEGGTSDEGDASGDSGDSEE